MARQTIFTGTTANDGTGDSLRSAGVKLNANFSELYGKFGSDLTLSELIDFDSASINISNPAQTFKTNISVILPTQNNFVKVPNYTGNFVVDSATQTLKNKTLETPVMVTPKFGDTTNTHQYSIVPSELIANRNITLPLLTGDDEFIFASHPQTITNKVLDSDQFINPRIEGDIKTYGGAPMLNLEDRTSGSAPVNSLSISNSLTGNPIDLIPSGADAAVDLRLRGKGAGATLLSLRVAFGEGNATVAETSNNSTYSATEPYIIQDDANPVGSVFQDLPDGSVIGEVRYITSRIASNTLRVTPDNFAQGTWFELASNRTAHLIWDGTNWFVVNTSDVTLG